MLQKDPRFADVARWDYVSRLEGLIGGRNFFEVYIDYMALNCVSDSELPLQNFFDT